MLKYIVLIIITTQPLFSQDKSADNILEKVKANFGLVNDYIVEMKGKVDLPDAIIPELKAKVYFKKPDKFKIESDNFMILPKQSIRFDPEILYREDYTSFVVSEIKIDKILHYVIKIIPNNPEAEQIFTLWVNSENFTIKKVNVIGSRIGRVEIDFENKLIDGKYWLPEKIVASFEARNFRFPKMKKTDEDKGIDADELKEGKIIINYFNYVVNKGIEDKIFEKK